MNNTHGNILYGFSTTNGSTTNDLVYRQKLEDTSTATGGLSSNSTFGSYNPPRGAVGWICPVCGRGLAPSTAYCPCNLTRDISYTSTTLNNINVNSIEEVLDKSSNLDYLTRVDVNSDNGFLSCYHTDNSSCELVGIKTTDAVYGGGADNCETSAWSVTPPTKPD